MGKLKILLAGINLLDVDGQYSNTQNAEFAKTPFSVSNQTLPLGLLYLAAAQREFGSTECDYLLYDFNLAPEQPFSLEAVYAQYENHLTDYQPAIVALGCLTQRQSSYLEKAIGLAREYVENMNPHARIIAGGAAASGEPERFLRAGSDAVAIGEGELTFTEFVDCVANGGSLIEVPGLVIHPDALEGPQSAGKMRDFNGPAARSQIRPLVEDIDSLPMPAWDLVDVSTYLKRNKGVFSPVLTERGCPYNCIYCQHVRKVRGHSAKRVVDEFEILTKKYGARRLNIVDEIFNFSRRRINDIYDEMKQRGIRVELQDFSGLRGDILDEQTLDTLREMGFVAFSLAVETADSRIQRLIGKRLDINRTVQAIKWATDRGIFVNVFFMIGFPTETVEEIGDTLALARDCASHQSTISKLEVYRGAPMWDLAVQQGLDPAKYKTDFIERYGERVDPGYMLFPEADLHSIWLRGVFDVYNNLPRMKRLNNLMSPVFVKPMYEKFYREHGVWCDAFEKKFRNCFAGGAPDFKALIVEAERRVKVLPIKESIQRIVPGGR